MSYRTDIVYRYDGGTDALLCCIFESYAQKELPAAIVRAGQPQPGLLPWRDICADPAHAARVSGAISARIGADALEMVCHSRLCAAPDAALCALRFVRLGLRAGARAMDMLDEPCVDYLTKAVRALLNEAHHLTGFIRFCDHGGVLSAIIAPKNRVLPVIRSHFTDRLSAETFLIYDSTHHEALAHQRGRSRIVPLEALTLPPPDESELFYRALWRAFHRAVAIEPRRNPRCQMSHMPRRYWDKMPEMDALTGKNSDAENEKICYNQHMDTLPQISSTEKRHIHL